MSFTGTCCVFLWPVLLGAVPRWDDIDSTSPMQTAESNGMDGLKIGYVPDEW